MRVDILRLSERTRDLRRREGVADRRARAQRARRAVPAPKQAVVGAIFFVRSETRSESWIEEEEDDEEPGGKRVLTCTKSHQTPGYYEVWAFPEPGSLLDKTGLTRCLRVQREHVVSVEEEWPIGAAIEAVALAKAATETVDEDEQADPPRADNGAATSPV
jgi:hypothetical protein